MGESTTPRAVTVGDIRRAIEGLPDVAPVLLTRRFDGCCDDQIDARLESVGRRDDTPAVAITVYVYSIDEDDDGDFEDDEPVGSCEVCGQDLYGDEANEGICDQCSWERGRRCAP